jgi:hypothetical protein
MTHPHLAGALALTASLLAARAGLCQTTPPPSPAPPAKEPQKPVTPANPADAIPRAVEVLLSLQEGDPKQQWPYEGVYRVKGEIPIGYRVGGTAICVVALVEAPGYSEDAARREAVERAVAFICTEKDHPLMSVEEYDAGYDVRCWGYIYAVHALCRLKHLNLVPESQREAVESAMVFYLFGIHDHEMPDTGGWNYARPPGKENKGSPSAFMTASALQALFEAQRVGYEVDAGVVNRALDFLEKTRTASGSVVYSGTADRRADNRTGDAAPGAVGRMTSTETALVLGGRGSLASVRASVDAFIVHWEWLEKRRAQPGTHAAPYGVAPYYFMFAHHAAAQAVELLPPAERPEYRRRINELLFSVRNENGSWNDRVFERSSAYGTAMAMLAIGQPTMTPPARWKQP